MYVMVAILTAAIWIIYSGDTKGGMKGHPPSSEALPLSHLSLSQKQNITKIGHFRHLFWIFAHFCPLDAGAATDRLTAQ